MTGLMLALLLATLALVGDVDEPGNGKTMFVIPNSKIVKIRSTSAWCGTMGFRSSLTRVNCLGLKGLKYIHQSHISMIDSHFNTVRLKKEDGMKDIA